MDLEELKFGAVLIVAGIFVLIIWYKKRKKLETHLLQYGVERKAAVEKVYLGRGLYLYFAQYENNGQQFKKRLFTFLDEDFGYSDKRTIPILIDPTDPKKVLFNIKKFDLRPVSGDSLTNFLERRKSYGDEEEDSSNIKVPGTKKGDR